MNFGNTTFAGDGESTFAGEMETMGYDWAGVATNIGSAIAPAGGGGGSINWSNIINQAFGVGSQAISAFSGKNSGTQIGYNPASQSVFAIQSSNTRGFDETPQYYAGRPQQAPAGYGPQGVGGTVGSGVDGIFNWLMSNPLITFGSIAAIYLLMKEPPRRR